jgi:hypothetical protein
MVLDWATPFDWAGFLEKRFGRWPHARPSSVHRAAALLDFGTFDRVLPTATDVLTVASGRLVEAPRPRSAADVRALLRSGVGTVVRGSERDDPALERLHDEFLLRLGCEVHVQLHATPAGTDSFGWHFDVEDVFIAQSMGVSEHYFRDNTVARDARPGDRLHSPSIAGETSQLLAARLWPGDSLYLPRRWWRMVKCVENSLTISVGAMPRPAGARRVSAGRSAQARG